MCARNNQSLESTKCGESNTGLELEISDYLFFCFRILISIDLKVFMIKTDDKNPRRFDLSEVIFKCELKMCK